MTAGLSVVIAACGFGETGTADHLSDVGFRAHGVVKSTVAGPTTYTFEYGPTAEYGSQTPIRTVVISDTSIGVPVTAAVDGLSEGTEYHYRLCAYDAEEVGSCGSDMVAWTLNGRDSVTGTAVPDSSPFALSIDVNGDADGGGESGTMNVHADGGHAVLVTGTVTCALIDGNRASMGFVAGSGDAGDPLTGWLVVIEDNGPTGDRVATSVRPEPTAACPYPSDDQLGPSVSAGDYVVHDHVIEL